MIVLNWGESPRIWIKVWSKFKPAEELGQVVDEIFRYKKRWLYSKDLNLLGFFLPNSAKHGHKEIYEYRDKSIWESVVALLRQLKVKMNGESHTGEFFQ